ncbi:MAG: signal peptide peptidase SppA [Bacteroidaceae bacterium]|nr:signal peptide peptidase SppA [Bacteroidaceae bacterium]
MKDFFKYVLATIVGVILTSIVMTIICIVSMAGMMASESMSQPVKDNSILRIKLQGTISEQASEQNPLDFLSNGEVQEIALDQALDALKKAAKSKKVKGIYLEGGVLYANPAELQELREGLVEFKKSGKWIVSYADQYSRAAYYLCSTADKVYMNPIGMLDWSGMASQPIFYKGLLEKVGVKMQVYKVGTYKSAVEPFICDQMSDANREQVTSFLGNIWENMLKDVAKSRKTTVEALNSLADSLTFLSDPEVSVKGGLVDKLCYKSQVREELKTRMELESDDKLTFTCLSDVANSEELNEKVDEEIAVYYAYGEIVDDRTSGFNREHNITAKDMTYDLQKLAEDDDVKAVVIRVNSPGGSAYASEQIWHEVELLKAKKPVVVSMGGMAASGGYYISCGANKIFSEATTLTGSIGIFGMIPDASELLTKKLGLSFDVVKTNALSDLGATGRPFNEEESRLIQAHVNKGYELFTGRVAKGRGLAQDSVKAIAEGRVWTGEQALKIGLVDKLGNLDDAIKAAAKIAKVEKYTIGQYPSAEPWYMEFLDKNSNDYMESHIRTLLGDEYYSAFSLIRNLKNQNPIQARLPFDPNIR